MTLIDGKALAAKIRGEIKENIETSGLKVTLAVVIVGDDPASKIYVKNKAKACAETGVVSIVRELPADCSQESLENTISELAADESVNGILLQLPLPAGLNERAALAKIPVEKDVDGFCESNVGKLAMNRGGIVACTPFGVMKMLESAREAREYFMPTWPMAMPSHTPMAGIRMGVPPAISTPALTASAILSRFIWPGTISLYAETTPISGRSSSSLV